jgi:hypothetical protein
LQETVSPSGDSKLSSVVSNALTTDEQSFIIGV